MSRYPPAATAAVPLAARSPWVGGKLENRDVKHTIVDKARLLRGVPLLSEVSTEVLADLAALSTVEEHDTDTTLFEEGDPADAFYVIIEGTVRGLRNGVETFRAGPGGEVGALAVLDERPRAFTATTEGAALALRIGAEDFLYLLEQHPRLARGVIRHLAWEMRDALGGEGRYGPPRA